jgi:hypothetical protein
MNGHARIHYDFPGNHDVVIALEVTDTISTSDKEKT